MLVVVVVCTVITDVIGEPPTYLVGLLGTAAGAFFTALGSDKGKREADVRETADRADATSNRAETKADAALHVAEGEHPESAARAESQRGLDPPASSGGAS